MYQDPFLLNFYLFRPRKASSCQARGLLLAVTSLVCRARALGTQASVFASLGLSHAGLGALQQVGSSRTGDLNSAPCVGRRILNHWTTREVQDSSL